MRSLLEWRGCVSGRSTYYTHVATEQLNWVQLASIELNWAPAAAAIASISGRLGYKRCSASLTRHMYDKDRPGDMLYAREYTARYYNSVVLYFIVKIHVFHFHVVRWYCGIIFFICHRKVNFINANKVWLHYYLLNITLLNIYQSLKYICALKIYRSFKCNG